MGQQCFTFTCYLSERKILKLLKSRGYEYKTIFNISKELGLEISKIPKSQLSKKVVWRDEVSRLLAYKSVYDYVTGWSDSNWFYNGYFSSYSPGSPILEASKILREEFKKII